MIPRAVAEKEKIKDEDEDDDVFYDTDDSPEESSEDSNDEVMYVLSLILFSVYAILYFYHLYYVPCALFKLLNNTSIV